MRVASYARSSFVHALSDGAIDVIVEQSSPGLPSICLFFVEHLHGVACRPAEAAAFSHRVPGHNFAALALWLDPAVADASSAWVRGFFDAMAPFLASGVYSNYLADEGSTRVRAAYGAAYERLVGVKRKYDPNNVFRVNQNIDPA
jgi:FAD/FMN-containing dehydrogenase